VGGSKSDSKAFGRLLCSRPKAKRNRLVEKNSSREEDLKMSNFLSQFGEPVELQPKNYDGFVVIGAGLPRTGTMSLRSALGILLNGACHHMFSVVEADKKVSENCIHIGNRLI
jgi:hypothetical protein